MLGATDALIEKRGRPAAGSPPQVHARVWALCGAPVFTGCMWPPGAMTAVAKTVGRRQQPYKSHGGASSRVPAGESNVRHPEWSLQPSQGLSRNRVSV